MDRDVGKFADVDEVPGRAIGVWADQQISARSPNLGTEGEGLQAVTGVQR
jgi:hypothetical protein